MVAGYHLIWTVYGSWLPNDPRGSSSHEIRNAAIASLGELHHGRKRIQPASGEIRKFYDAARSELKHEPLTFSHADVAIIAESFANAIRINAYTSYACAIMPDHVHILIRKHRHKAEDMIQKLQDASRAALIDAGVRPAGHPVWGGPGWKVFLETREDIERTIRYIEDNPVRARLPMQKWNFVAPDEGWLPGVTSKRPHSPIRTSCRGSAGPDRRYPSRLRFRHLTSLRLKSTIKDVNFAP